MLKLNSSKVLLACIIAAISFNCNDGKTHTKEQNKSADTLTANTNAVESHTSASPDTTNANFNISIEGYKATPLGQAAYSGDITEVQDLVAQGASIEKCLTDETYIYDILYTALVFNKTELVRFILKNKFYSSLNETYTEEAETPLTLACSLANNSDALEIADSLINLGADVNGAGPSGGERTMYPLLIAVKQNNVDLTKLLLEHRANKDIKNESGETPLTIAEKNGFQDIATLLKGN